MRKTVPTIKRSLQSGCAAADTVCDAILLAVRPLQLLTFCEIAGLKQSACCCDTGPAQTGRRSTVEELHKRHAGHQTSHDKHPFAMWRSIYPCGDGNLHNWKSKLLGRSLAAEWSNHSPAVCRQEHRAGPRMQHPMAMLPPRDRRPTSGSGTASGALLLNQFDFHKCYDVLKPKQRNYRMRNILCETNSVMHVFS